ncbi:MAG: hypothetical protein K1X50_04785, partial [Candidatus Promineofilum sp.]|nr:hypothetical protein [Promineifilum sp.]
ADADPAGCLVADAHGDAAARADGAALSPVRGAFTPFPRPIHRALTPRRAGIGYPTGGQQYSFPPF